MLCWIFKDLKGICERKMRMCSLSDSTVCVISMAEIYNKALSLNYTAFGFPPSVIRLQLESHYTYTRVGLHSPNGTGLSQRRWNSFQRNNFNTGGQMLLSITHMWLSQWFQWRYSGVTRGRTPWSHGADVKNPSTCIDMSIYMQVYIGIYIDKYIYRHV